MKRRIPILFILLANIAILAHAVIPHHHHNGLFVALVNVFDEDSQAYSDLDKDCQSKHHDAQSEDCVLNDALLSGTYRTQKSGSPDIGAPHLDLFIGSTAETALPETAAGQAFIFKPYTEGGPTARIACSIGLRAPPAC